LGEIRAILGPVDQGDASGLLEKIRQNRAYSIALQGQNSPVLTDEARAGVLRYFNWTAPPNGFTFSITGIQGRTISFSTSKNETFSYGCADCSFVVSENGVSKAVSTTESGVEFKLGTDGSTLIATCHSAPCSMRMWSTGVNWAVNGKTNDWANDVSIIIGKANPASPQTFTIATSQLMQKQGGSVLFVVTKPAGQ
jgi:hypothetical protein